MIGESLLRFQKDLKIIVADKETEGLHLGKSRPWQCAFNVYHGNVKVASHNLYPWWPDLNVSPGAAAVTRFNYYNYKDKAEDPKKCRQIFRSYVDDPSYFIVMHNGLGYDSMIEAVWARAVGEEVKDFDWLLRLLDTNCIAKAMKLGIKPDVSSRINFLAWQFQMCSIIKRDLKTNLTAMGKEFQIPFDYAMLHEGLSDIDLNFIVFNKLKQVVDI